MYVRFLQYTPSGDDLISNNTIDLSIDGSAVFFTDASYNSDNFTPKSMEIDTSGLNTIVTLQIDGFKITFNPGTYALFDIDGATTITMTGSEKVLVNFYKNSHPERLITTPSNNFTVNTINYQSWGMYNSLKINLVGGVYVWDAGNPAPFNNGLNIGTPVRVLPANQQRLHLALFSDVGMAYTTSDALFDMRVGQNSNPNGGSFQAVPFNALYYNSPLIRSEVWVYFQLSYAPTGTPTGNIASINAYNYITCEEYSR